MRTYTYMVTLYTFPPIVVERLPKRTQILGLFDFRTLTDLTFCNIINYARGAMEFFFIIIILFYSHVRFPFLPPPIHLIICILENETSFVSA